MVVVDPVYKNNEIISSSAIRKVIVLGHINEVTKMLGHPYFLAT